MEAVHTDINASNLLSPKRKPEIYRGNDHWENKGKREKRQDDHRTRTAQGLKRK